MLVSFVCIVADRLFALVLLLARSDRAKELEARARDDDLSVCLQREPAHSVDHIEWSHDLSACSKA